MPEFGMTFWNFIKSSTKTEHSIANMTGVEFNIIRLVMLSFYRSPERKKNEIATIAKKFSWEQT